MTIMDGFRLAVGFGLAYIGLVVFIAAFLALLDTVDRLTGNRRS
jgi:hypothetical protein